MYVLISIVAFVILILLLVGIHELGHFATARLFGVRVSEFGFGFPPRVWGRRRGETLYSINAIPLGGFVRMEGENGEVESARSFGAKPAWQRAIILCAGAAMNLLGALVLFFLVFTIAPIPQFLPRVSLVQPHSPAAGFLRVGDVIVSVAGQDVGSQTEVHDLVECNAGKPTVFIVQRAGRQFSYTVTPRLNPPAGQGRVGFAGTVDDHGADGLSALGETVRQPVDFVKSIGKLFNGPRCNPAGAGVTGPIGIAQATGDAANAVPRLGMGPVLYLAAIVSMNLAIVNLLPFPALDGGRLLFVLIGVARRRRVSPQREGLIHLLGMLVLLGLVLVVSGHDISQWLNQR